VAVAANFSGLPDQPALALNADTADATPLTNGSIALNWQPLAGTRQYDVYSDMGSGFGVFVHKTQTEQPAFIDHTLRSGVRYRYRVTAPAELQELVLAQLVADTFALNPAYTESTSRQVEETAPPAIFAAPTALPPDAVLLGLVSDNNYTDEFNTLTIVGEVRNDSNLDVGHTDITVTFYDSAGAIIGTANGETMLDVIPPGEKSPFVITLSRPPGLASHSLRAVARPVAPKQGAQLVVSEVRRFEDDAGFFHVKGTVKNVGSSTARRVKVAAVIYARDNRVINVGFTYGSPPKLAPGQQASYDIIFSYYPRYVTQLVIPFEE